MRALRFLKQAFLLWQNLQKNRKNRVKMPVLQKRLHGGAMYMQKQCIHRATVRVDSPLTASDSAEHRLPLTTL